MNPLANVLPAKVRAVVYAVVFVLGLAFAAYQASNGDWIAFAGGLIAALTTALAHGNVEQR